MGSAVVTSNDRVIRSLLAGFGLGVVIGVLWFAGQIAVAANTMETVTAQGVGYSTFIAAPLAGVLASVSGFILGAITQKGKLRWYCLWVLVVFSLLFVGWIYLLFSDPGAAPRSVSA